jgi:hypothetical protein
LFDHDLTSFTPEEECLKRPLDLIDAHSMRYDLVQVGAMLSKPAQVRW